MARAGAQHTHPVPAAPRTFRPARPCARSSAAPGPHRCCHPRRCLTAHNLLCMHHSKQQVVSQHVVSDVTVSSVTACSKWCHSKQCHGTQWEVLQNAVRSVTECSVKARSEWCHGKQCHSTQNQCTQCCAWKKVHVACACVLAALEMTACT